MATGAGGRWHSPLGKGTWARNTANSSLRKSLRPCDNLIHHLPARHPKGMGTGLEFHCSQTSGRFLPEPSCSIDTQALFWAGLERPSNLPQHRSAPVPARPSPARAPMLRSHRPPVAALFCFLWPQAQALPAIQTVTAPGRPLGGTVLPTQILAGSCAAPPPPGASRCFKRCRCPGSTRTCTGAWGYVSISV